LVEIFFKTTTGLSRVYKASLFDQTRGEIMDRRQALPGYADVHGSAVFAESHIAAIVPTSFDQLILPSDPEHFGGGSLFPGYVSRSPAMGISIWLIY
jgi:hypothetical protein